MLSSPLILTTLFSGSKSSTSTDSPFPLNCILEPGANCPVIGVVIVGSCVSSVGGTSFVSLALSKSSLVFLTCSSPTISPNNLVYSCSLLLSFSRSLTNESISGFLIGLTLSKAFLNASVSVSFSYLLEPGRLANI